MTPARFIRGLKPGRPLLVLLDFDGTLSSIRRDRDKAVLSARWRRLLARAVAAEGVRVALVSGRGLADLRSRADVGGLVWVGNHGLHWSRPGWGPPKRELARWRGRIQRSLGPLRRLLKEHPGADLEDKGLDLCIHLRAMGRGRRAVFEAELRGMAKGLGMAVSRGKLSLELRPPGAWNKGQAVARLRARVGRSIPCFYAGDDTTDEHAFRALAGARNCLTFKVGRPPTLADGHGSRAQLHALIRRILRAQERTR